MRSASRGFWWLVLLPALACCGGSRSDRPASATTSTVATMPTTAGATVGTAETVGEASAPASSMSTDPPPEQDPNSRMIEFTELNPPATLVDYMAAADATVVGTVISVGWADGTIPSFTVKLHVDNVVVGTVDANDVSVDVGAYSDVSGRHYTLRGGQKPAVGDRATAFLRKGSLPPGQYGLLNTQSLFILRGGATLPSFPQGDLAKQLAVDSPSSLSKQMTTAVALGQAAFNARLENDKSIAAADQWTGKPQLLASIPVAGSTWTLTAVATAGGFCYGYGTTSPSLTNCLHGEAARPGTLNAFQTDEGILLGLASNDVRSVLVGFDDGSNITIDTREMTGVGSARYFVSASPIKASATSFKAASATSLTSAATAQGAPVTPSSKPVLARSIQLAAGQVIDLGYADGSDGAVCVGASQRNGDSANPTASICARQADIDLAIKSGGGVFSFEVVSNVRVGVCPAPCKSVSAGSATATTFSIPSSRTWLAGYSFFVLAGPPGVAIVAQG